MTRYPLIPVDDMHLLTEYVGDPIVIDGPETYKSISAARGAPTFQFAQWYIDRVPLFLNGEAHRKLTDLITARFAERHAKVSSRAAFTDDQKSELRSGRNFNIVDDICEPAVHRVLGLYMICPESSREYLRNFNAVSFHRELRHGKFKKLDTHLAAIFAATQASEETRRYCDTIPAIIVARQSLLRMLAMSLDEVFASCQSNALEDLQFPVVPPKGSIPYVHRVVPEDLKGIHGVYRKGDVYLCPVSMRIGERNPPLLPSFGKGTRACLGRTMAMFIWREIASDLTDLMRQYIQDGATRFEIVSPVDFGEFGERPTHGDLRFE